MYDVCHQLLITWRALQGIIQSANPVDSHCDFQMKCQSMGVMLNLIVFNQVESRITFILVIGLSRAEMVEAAVSAMGVLSAGGYFSE